MTEEQIIKALECCSNPLCKCHECPYKKMDEMCFDDVKRDALSLINRQSAQIEHLTAENKRLQSLLNDLMKDEVST